MKKAFEKAKIEKIIVSVANTLTASDNNTTDGSFNLGGNAGQGWDDIGGNKA